MTDVLLWLLMVALLAAAGSNTVAAPRVRSTHPYIGAILAEAQVRSVTFRRLIHDIDATDGIVYVEEGDCHAFIRSCLSPILTAAGGFRFLRVIVDARQNDWQVMADIGHELQHAVEVLANRHLRSTNEVLFQMIKPGHGAAVESVDSALAVEAGLAVRGEVKAFARNNSTRWLARTKSADEHSDGDGGEARNTERCK